MSTVLIAADANPFPNRPTLRAFQKRAKDELRAAFARGLRRILIVAPTGAGKGTMIVDLALDACIKRNHIAILSHRSDLQIDQEGRSRLAGLLRIDVVRGSEGVRDPGAFLHILSIDSMRNKSVDGLKIVIIDEAHRALSASYIKFLERHPDVLLIGMSATPCRLDGKPLSDVFDHMIVATQQSELLAAGLLAPAAVFTVKKEDLPDLDGVGSVGGDYNAKQLSARVNTKQLVGAVVDHWKRRAGNRATIAFCTDRKHSGDMAAAFNTENIPAEHIDGDATTAERQALMERVRAGVTKVVCQCQLWIEGVDLPELKCAILARPTKSLTIYLQGCGRIMRPWDDQSAIVLDHARAVHQHDMPQIDRDWQAVFDADPKEKKPGGQPPIKICPPEDNGCGMIVPLSSRVCPTCSHEFPVKPIVEVEGELVEVTSTQTKAQIAALKAAAKKDPRGEVARAAFDRYWREAYSRGYDDAWVMRRFAERFGDAPDATWPPPERPKIAYTLEQKRAERMTLIGIAHRQGKGPAWVAERYRLKIGAEISELDAPAAKALPAPSADDVPALPSGEVTETEF